MNLFGVNFILPSKANLKDAMSKREQAKLIMKMLPKIREAEEKVVIPWEEVNKALKAGCSGRQIASALNISPAVLYYKTKIDHLEEWESYKQRHHDMGIKEILETQHMVAIKYRDRQMLMWLGKVRCGQVEANPTSGQKHTSKIEKIFSQLFDDNEEKEEEGD